MKESAQIDRYQRAWMAVSKLLSNGRSWSGKERNNCFLNTGGRQFTDVSAAIGWDDLADGRAVALVDWDADGDLDFWMSNRTAPRVRLLRNNQQSGNHFLSLKLHGVKCNRDAIGARVELKFKKTSPLKFQQTLRAGEGYLAQSSKWLHFGLADQEDIDRVIVHWPGGQAEEFHGLQVDRRWRLTQGEGTARQVEPRQRSLRLVSSQPKIPRSGQTARIVAHRRLPMPKLEYLDFNGRRVIIGEKTSGPKLVNLWASWCQPCLAELKQMAASSRELESVGLDVIALNIEAVEKDSKVDSTKIQQLLKKLNPVVSGGLATKEIIDRLDIVQRTIISKQDALPLPSSFLLDRRNQLVAIYKGPVDIQQLLADVADLSQKQDDVRDLAVPFPGRWYTNVFPPDLLAIPRQMIDLEMASEAYEYLTQHVNFAPTAKLPAGLSQGQLADVYQRVGAELAKQKNFDNAERSLRLALRFQPTFWDAHVELAAVLESQGRIDEALSEHREMYRLRPGHPAAANNIAWILATREPQKEGDAQQAISLAEVVCKRTAFRLPSALDTLAAAYASAGRFEDAIKTAQQAIDLAKATGQQATVDNLQNRLQLYEQGLPFRR